MAKRDVVRLLVRLFGDPRALERYRKNPEKFLAAARLSAAERELLQAADEEAIRAYLGTESAKTNVVKTALTNVVKSGITNVVKSGVTNVVKSALTNVVKTAIPSSKRKPSGAGGKPKKKS